MSLENLKPILTEYAELHVTKKTIEARLKELGEQVRPTLMGQGAVVVGDYQFDCTQQAGRKTLDKKAMEADGIDLEPYYKVGAPFTKLNIKEIKNVG